MYRIVLLDVAGRDWSSRTASNLVAARSSIASLRTLYFAELMPAGQTSCVIEVRDEADDLLLLLELSDTDDEKMPRNESAANESR